MCSRVWIVLVLCVATALLLRTEPNETLHQPEGVYSRIQSVIRAMEDWHKARQQWAECIKVLTRVLRRKQRKDKQWLQRSLIEDTHFTSVILS